MHKWTLQKKVIKKKEKTFYFLHVHIAKRGDGVERTSKRWALKLLYSIFLYIEDWSYYLFHHCSGFRFAIQVK